MVNSIVRIKKNGWWPLAKIETAHHQQFNNKNKQPIGMKHVLVIRTIPEENK